MLRDQMGLSPSTAAETLEAQILVHDASLLPRSSGSVRAQAAAWRAVSQRG